MSVLQYTFHHLWTDVTNEHLNRAPVKSYLQAHPDWCPSARSSVTTEDELMEILNHSKRFSNK